MHTQIGNGMKRSQFLKTIVGAAAACALPGAIAQGERPVRIVIGVPAGAGPDSAARILADTLRTLWKQPVIVENKPGAGGMLAMDQVRAAAPDGNMLVFAHASALVVTPRVVKAARYDPVADFTPIGQVAEAIFMIVGAPGQPANNLADLVRIAKDRPGVIGLGSSEQASLPYLLGQDIARRTGARFNHVPFTQTGQAIQAVVNGDVEYYVDGAAPLRALVQAGRLKAIAVSSERRLPWLPSVQAMAELLPGYAAGGWFALLGPKGLSSEHAARLNRDLNEALGRPEVVARLQALSLAPTPTSSDGSAAFLTREVARWGELISGLGLEFR